VRGLRGAALAAIAASLFVPMASEPAAAVQPRVNVWPHTDLVDDQSVLINVRNWVTNRYLSAVFCPAGADPYVDRCDYAATLVPGRQGNIRVRRPADVIVDGVGHPVDCRIDACELLVFDVNAEDDPDPVIRRVPLGYEPSGPDPERPPTTVAPHTDLRAGDVVTVTGDSFPIREAAAVEAEGDDGPVRPVSVYECRTPALSYLDCDTRTREAGMSPAGDFSTSFTIRSRLYLHDGSSVDCRVGTCALVATSNHQFSEAGLRLLDLDPAGPAPPAPIVTVEPADDLVDGQDVTVTGEHFLPNGHVELYQCPPGATGYGWQVCHDLVDFRATNGQGRIAITRAVHTVLEGMDGTPVDCRDVVCTFVLSHVDVIDHAPTVPLGFDPGAPLLALELTASPSTDLVPLQRVTVTGEDFYPTDIVRPTECVVARAARYGFTCDYRDDALALPDGAREFSTTYRVHQHLHTDLGVVNCQRRICFIAVWTEETGIVRGNRLVYRP
jgi:hypothetical protein